MKLMSTCYTECILQQEYHIATIDYTVMKIRLATKPYMSCVEGLRHTCLGSEIPRLGTRVAPDIRPFLLSGIRPDIRLQVPDIRPIIMKKITEF